MQKALADSPLENKSVPFVIRFKKKLKNQFKQEHRIIIRLKQEQRSFMQEKSLTEGAQS